MSTFRLYSDTTRVATAVLLNDNRMLQVYPTKQTFETQADWIASYPQMLTLQESKKEPKPKPQQRVCPTMRQVVSRVQQERLNRELMEFFDPSYAWMFKTVEIHGIPKVMVKCTLCDDSQWEIERDYEFVLNPPSLKKNGVDLLDKGKECWSPVLTTIRWLMMHAFLDYEED